jgi:hypothetical protein
MIKITSLVFVLTLSLGVMFSSIATCEGLLRAFAQDNQTRATSSSSVAASLSGSQSHIPKIKITSPTRDQQLPAGKDLTVYGISIDNATSNDCKVSVIVNKVRPYQPATATGPGGATDYSKWKFDITSKYTTIKQGDNRITSKYECANNPDGNSFSSVNLTGTSDAGTTAASSNQTNSSSSATQQRAINSTTGITTAASPSLSSNQTNSSSSSSSSSTPLPAPSLGANQIAKQQQAAANNSGARNNTTTSPLANIPVIGKLFGGK